MRMVFDVKPQRGSERVKAWLYAVLNPLIESFRRENQLLQGGNLSWRVHTRRCEYIRPSSEFVTSNQWPNLEDFLAENTTFRDRFAEHDSAVLQLEQVTSHFVRGLLASSVFAKRVAECLSDYESKRLSTNPEYPDLSDPRGQIPEYVTEFIVNNATSLPAHYNLHFFWQVFADRFQEFLVAFKQGEPSNAAKKVMTLSGDLASELESLRLTLCREYDIPAAPIEARSLSPENVLFR